MKKSITKTSDTSNVSPSRRNEYTAHIERDGKWFIACCPEVLGANGQGKTKGACLKSLDKAVQLIREDQ